ncbi:MAG TPA: hypothetical protein GX695_00540 [Acholeplasmataceae bacterium]|nr:hypothetical protein [Acholeplasmataceae bacterium]
MDEINEIKYNISRHDREKQKMMRKELQKKLYLGEIIELEKPIFESNNMILSPVGSGKSYLIEEMLIPKNFKNKVIYLTSNTALKDSLAPNDNDVRNLLSKKGKSKGFYTSANENCFGDVHYKVHVMTYSEFGEKMLSTPHTLLKDVELVFCDEIHSLPIYFSYDNNYKLAVALFWLLNKQSGIQIFYFTATQESISVLENKDPGRLNCVKIFNYLNHPKIRKYVAKATHYVSHIEQTRSYLSARKEAFDYYGYKALAFTRLITEQEKIKEIAEEEGFMPLVLWSINNTEKKLNKEQLKSREILLRTGLIPEPYNMLIINGSMQEGWNLFDDAVTLAILDTVDITEQIQALGRIRKDIDLVIKKTKNEELLGKSLNIPNEYLEIPLISADKERLCNYLNLINSRGEIKKWRSIKKIIEKMGYIIVDKTLVINDKRTRVSIIQPPKSMFLD